MTKVRYTRLAGALVSRGFNFEVSGEYEVPDEVAHYLTKTFSNNFEFVTPKKPEVVKVVKDEPKEVVEEVEVKKEAPKKGVRK